MTRISRDEFPNRAFQLAYFIHRERKTALEITTRALNKLQLAATAQGKRLYYRLTGRADARKARSKVSMGEPHLLQRLVYVESEEYERRKEAAAQNSQLAEGVSPARRKDLVVYFIKHLVRITTKRNSFYVTLGLSRLLYNYTTPETMELYNLVIQDPDRVHDDYYYRSRKGLLLREMKERFGETLELAKGVRGEQRWRPAEDTSRYLDLVRECLFWFTPWATACVVPERFDPLSDPIDQLNFQGRHADEEHEVEVNRIHAALHPDCFARLAAANLLDRPEAKLELPHFFLSEDADGDDDSSRTPPNLAEDELLIINDLLVQEATRRKAASAGFLRVLVDGNQLAQISAGQPTATKFMVDHEAEVIEVYGSDQEGPLLLATHLLNFSGSATQNFAITIEGGQRISFTVEPLRDREGISTGAQVAVAVAETSATRAAAAAARSLWTSIFGQAHETPTGSLAWWKPVSALAALALLFAGAWWVWSNRQDRTEIVMTTPKPAPTIPTIIPSPNQQKDREPSPRPGEAPGAVATATPTPAKRQPGTRERDETFVARTLVADDSVSPDPGELSTRSAWNRQSMGKPLNEVSRVYVQAIGDNALNQALLAEVRARLVAGGAVQDSGADQADAALKFSARPASARADDLRVSVTVRVVNANGYVVWPGARGGSRWRYVGQPRFVAERIVADLVKDIRSRNRER